MVTWILSDFSKGAQLVRDRQASKLISFHDFMLLNFQGVSCQRSTKCSRSLLLGSGRPIFPPWELDFSVRPFLCPLSSVQLGSPVSVFREVGLSLGLCTAGPRRQLCGTGADCRPSPCLAFQRSGVSRPQLCPCGSSEFLDPSVFPWVLAAGSALTTSPQACLWVTEHGPFPP